MLEPEDERLAKISIAFDQVPEAIMVDMTPVEIILAESLLTPGLQTSVRVHSYQERIEPSLKDLDTFKASKIGIALDRPILRRFGVEPKMNISQVVYRIDNRQLVNNVVHEFTIHACDQSLLNDAASLVSWLWKCTTPSEVASDVLRRCAGVSRLDIQESTPARDYIAENIHPFQVVQQQAQAALDNDSPSFVHYMTYENLGTHHFRSLDNLTAQSPIATYTFNETGQSEQNSLIAGYPHVFGIMNYSFPCDFDLLSDLLNGVSLDGQNINSAFTFNPLQKMFNIWGNNASGCGMGSGVVKNALSNQSSATQQNACPDYSHIYLQKRQARMALLEQDKIALRVTVPWNPELHAGKIIKVDLFNKEALIRGQRVLNYGSGKYLIVSLKHNIKYGGFATTTMDCVTQSTGKGMIDREEVRFQQMDVN